MLFYQPSRHKVCFVKSGDWLQPAHFNGSWTLDSIVADIARRTGAPSEIIEHSLPKLTDRLIKNRVITYEVR